MSSKRKCKAEKQGCAMNQAVLLACMYIEVDRGLGGSGGCILHEHSCCGDVPPCAVHERLSPRELQRSQKLAIIFVCHFEVSMLNFGAAQLQGDAMANPDHIAKRRRLNSPPPDQGELDDDYVCYGTVGPTAFLHRCILLLKTTFHSLSI